MITNYDRTFTEQLLGVKRDKPSEKQVVSIANNWQAWLEMAYAQLPAGAILQQIRYPRPPKKTTEKTEVSEDKTLSLISLVKEQAAKKNKVTVQKPDQVLTFQFHAAGDWLGLANSNVMIDKQDSLLVNTRLFAELSLGEKVFAMLKPLHTGHDLPAYYVVLQLILSLLGTIMVFSGLVSFIIKKRRRSKVARWINAEALTLS